MHIRLSPNSTLRDLPKEDVRLFRALGVNIVLLDKPEKESFAQLVYDKFLTINMTRYRRVMFMDGDMLPVTNLDYYFQLSDPKYQDILQSKQKSGLSLGSRARRTRALPTEKTVKNARDQTPKPRHPPEP